MGKQVNDQSASALKVKRQPKTHYTFVGITIKDNAEVIAGFYSTFKDAASALNAGKVVAVSVWNGETKVSR